uniref:Uncharacterized protein n=1 Tax=Avena sativa TaxID=4498 RepID=A0ACD5XMR5_AVESA
MQESEWPPSVYKVYVFSSKSGRWEEKDFLRDGDAAGTVGEMQKRYSDFRSIYLRGALYVKCGDDFLMRLSLSNNTYNVIKPPMDLQLEGRQEVSIARSEKGVYFLALYKYRLGVWVLNESSGQMEWMLTYDKDLKPMLAYHRFDHRVHAPWNLEDINYNLFLSSRSPEENNKPATGKILEWNSDDDGDDEKENMAKHSDSKDNKDCYGYGDIEILGLHPYKEYDSTEEGSVESNDTLYDDTDLAAPTPAAELVVPTSKASSITKVSNAGDYEDDSILHLLDYDSGSESPYETYPVIHHAIYMANNTELTVDPFTTCSLPPQPPLRSSRTAWT